MFLPRKTQKPNFFNFILQIIPSDLQEVIHTYVHIARHIYIYIYLHITIYAYMIRFLPNQIWNQKKSRNLDTATFHPSCLWHLQTHIWPNRRFSNISSCVKLQHFTKLIFFNWLLSSAWFLRVANISKITHHLYLIINYFFSKIQPHLVIGLSIIIDPLQYLYNDSVGYFSYTKSKVKAKRNLETFPESR